MIENLEHLKQIMRAAGARRLYVKPLSANDNSKNQVYLGSDFSALNMLPSAPPVVDESRDGTLIFKASVDFYWLDGFGTPWKAPNAQMILYPQYPEVRFSGFLKGCEVRPSQLMTSRIPDRLLFFGISDSGRIFGYVSHPDHAIARQFCEIETVGREGVFSGVSLEGERDSRTALLAELRRIVRLGWIDSKRLSAMGTEVECRGPNCGGYTLEAELGITPNARSQPDYLDWEVKQYSRSSARITLMTPEPTQGFYRSRGVVAFVTEFGYPDQRGRVDRRNFGGLYKAGRSNARTRLKLVLEGFEGKKITDPNGGLALVSPEGEYAAIWKFTDLMAHWQRKHSSAVFVPSEIRRTPHTQYRYGPEIRLGIGTDFLHLLEAIDKGVVYYDPGIKVENWSKKLRVQDP